MPVPTSEAYGKQRTPYRVKDFRLEVTRITPVWPRRLYIQWNLRKPTSSTGYVFKVSRSGSSEGPWEVVADGLVDTFFYIDEDYRAPKDLSGPGLHSLRQAIYYKVEVDHTADGHSEEVKSLEPGLDRRRQGIHRKLRRDAHVALKKGNGTEVAILKRKWWGEPCDCKSSTGQITRSHCSKCQGTGVIDGYWDPVFGYASITATPVDTMTTPEGTTEVNTDRIIMMDIPEVRERDIVVFLRSDKRFTIQRVTTTEIHQVTVHQELDVSELARSSVEYNMEVDRWHDPKWF